MLSYWEKQSLLHYDIIIVGSGIVGLSTAISIKEKKPSLKILVLERGILPTGASTKNAGFACIGSLTEILDDLAHITEDEVLQLVEMRYKGLKKLRSRLGEDNIEYRANGSYELISVDEEAALNELDNVNRVLQPILKKEAFTLSDEKISDFGFGAAYTKHLVKNNFEGELHTGKMMRSLIDFSIEKGIEIKTGCEVQEIEESNYGVNVLVNNIASHEIVCFTSSKVVVCTNAFTKQFYPSIDITPGRGQVLLTKPVEGLKFKGIFHFDKGYYYFRELNGRVLFGGGRNKDFGGEQTIEFKFSELIYQDLLEKLQTIILPENEFEIEDRWVGIMAFGDSKFPIVKQHSSRLFLGARMGGMGVAIGSHVGEMLAGLVIEN